MKKVFVNLVQTDVDSPTPVPHEIQHANTLLKIKGCAWKLEDKEYTYNGIEIVKKKK